MINYVFECQELKLSRLNIITEKSAKTSITISLLKFSATP